MVLVLPDAFQLILRHRVVQLLMVPGHQTFITLSDRNKELYSSTVDQGSAFREIFRGGGRIKCPPPQKKIISCEVYNFSSFGLNIQIFKEGIT